MPFRYKIELDDVEGHGARHYEDLTGQAVTIRTEDGTEVQGHMPYIRWREDQTGEPDDKDKQEQTGDDTLGHGNRLGIELEVDDTQANMLRAATDRGEPVYVRFPDGAEVKGHGSYRPVDMQPEPEVEGHGGFRPVDMEPEREVEGHGTRHWEDQTGEDTEGHGNRTP